MSTGLQKYRVVREDDQRLTLRERLRDLVRNYMIPPLSASSHEWGDGRQTATGLPVNEHTALNYSALFAAVNLISGDIASLPLQLFKRESDSAKVPYRSHPLYYLLHDQPNPEMTSVVFRQTLQAHALTWGGGYAEIVRTNGNTPAELWPITPDRVSPFRLSAGAPLQYRIRNPGGTGDTILDASDILHIPGLGYDGTTGYSVVHKARETIGLGLATERFGGTFFGEGATFGGVIAYKGAKPTDGSQENLIKAINAKHQGVDKAHRFLALYNDATYTRMGIPPDDAQFLQTRQFQVSEIARWFNIPPHKLAELERSTHSNIEQQEIEYVVGCLGVWLQKWEQELTVKLIAPSELNLQLIEHNVDARLKGDSAARGELYSKLFSIAAVTPNIIAAKENLPSIKGGDRAFVPLNMIPLDRVDDYINAVIDGHKAPKTPPTPAPNPPANANNRIDDLEQELRDARRLSQEREDAKDLANARLAEQAVERLTVEAEWAATRMHLDGQHAAALSQAEALGLDLLTAQHDVEAARGREAELQRAAEDAATALASAHRDTETLRSERDAAQADAATIRADRDAQVDLVRKNTEYLAMVEADYQRVCQEKSDLDTRHGVIVAELDETSRRAGEYAAERDTHAKTIEEQRSTIESLSLDITERDRQIGEATHRAETAEAVIAELRAQAATFTERDEKAQTALIEMSSKLTRAETLTIEQQEAQVRNGLALAVVEAERRELSERAAQTRQALRRIAIDLLGFFLERETGRARRAQGSPDKLKAWVLTFYPAQQDVLTSSVRSVMTAAAAMDGQSLSTDALDEFVSDYLARSQRELLALAAEHDEETLAPALERVLRRWETGRAEQAADLLLRKVA